MSLQLVWTERFEDGYDNLDPSVQDVVDTRLNTVQESFMPEHFIGPMTGYDFEKIKVGRSGYRIFVLYLSEIDTVFLLDIQPRDENTYRPRDADLIQKAHDELEAEINEIAEQLGWDEVQQLIAEGELFEYEE